MIIKTKEFNLRPFRKGDERSLAAHINNKKIYKNTLRIPYPYRLKHAREWIQRCKKGYKDRAPKELVFAVDIDGEAVGSVGLHEIEGHKAEIGYWLAEKYWGNGIMPQAVKLIAAYGFKRLKLKRIYGQAFHFNVNSAKVLRKAGFVYEGKLRKNACKHGKYYDTLMFAKVK